MHIGRNISKIRELLGIKQQTLADELKISQQTLSKIEQTERLPEKSVERIANAMNVSVKAILNYDDRVLIEYLKSSASLDEHPGQPEYVRLFEKVVELYERLLRAECEKRKLER